MEETNVPTSWNYGSFHLHSRLYTSFMQREADNSVSLQRKYEPLTNVSGCYNMQGNHILPPHGTPKHKDHSGIKLGLDDRDLKIEDVRPQPRHPKYRRHPNSNSPECPKNKIATEEYYRALKTYKEVCKNAKNLEKWNQKALSILLGGSPSPIKRNCIDNKENYPRNFSSSSDRNLQTELDRIELPRETMYMIDKVVRQRIQKGPFGMDNSELIGDQHEREVNEKNDRIQRMVEGMSSHSRIINTGEDEHREGDISTEGIVRRINSVCGRTASSMIPNSVKAIHFSDEK